MKQLASIISLLLLSFVVSATEDQVTFQSEQQKLTYLELIAELRCPKCQNQNIADSNAVVAKDMRVKTKALLDEGQNKQQVIEYMVNRYGQFAHYQPPLNPATSLLWLLPVAFILLAMFLLFKRSQAANKPLSQLASNQLDVELEQLLSESGDETVSSDNKTVNNSANDLQEHHSKEQHSQEDNKGSK